MHLRRFVTYIYSYDQGQRGQNAGFIKTDIRDSGCRIQIQVRGLERFQGRAQLYLIVSDENATAIPAGEIMIGAGGGRGTLFFPRNLLGDSGWTADQIQAVAFRYGEGKMLLSCWTDHVPEDVLRGSFPILDTQDQTKEAPRTATDEDAQPVKEEFFTSLTTVGEAEGKTQDTSRSTPEEVPSPRESISDRNGAQHDNTPQTETPQPVSTPQTEIPQTQTPRPDSTLQAQTPQTETPQPVSTPQAQTPQAEEPLPHAMFRKIEITDIRELPKRNWHLCSNSFLVHGFFNYHYLILKTIEEDGKKNCWIGVPGIYEQPERMMALLFGFPEFEPAKTEDNSAGPFGYWMCRLEM